MTPRAWLLLCCVLPLSCSRGSATLEDDDDLPGHQGGANATGTGGAGAATAGAGVLAGSTSGGNSQLPALEQDTAAGAFVHLFEWRWADIARECETFLGPHGFTAVQVSPPSEHAVLAQNGHPWWQRYQTVSYSLESRSGTRAEFVDMVARCREAGVGIYVDAILNHMTGQTSGVGSAGTRFTKYAYPDLFEQADFHAPVCQIQGADYTSSAERVQSCELLGLADLDTSSQTVQAKLAGYLSELLALGVRGFRIDAAKHMAPGDVAGILDQVTPRADEAPYYFLEVIDHGGEAVHATDYLDVASDAELDVTEFRYKLVGDAFLGRAGQSLASLAQLSLTTESFLPNERAVVFLNNHDTQRGDALFYQDGAAHELGTVFMLAWPYGYPSVMSSYGFDRGTDAGVAAGPPSAEAGSTDALYAPGAEAPGCAAAPFDSATRGFICEHRQRYVVSMLAFRRETAGAAVTMLWDNGGNQLAFGRDGHGFVAINHDQVPLQQSLPTGLPAGEYCDVLSGDFTAATGSAASACTGGVITVDAEGLAALDLPAETALALHTAAQL